MTLQTDQPFSSDTHQLVQKTMPRSRVPLKVWFLFDE